MEVTQNESKAFFRWMIILMLVFILSGFVILHSGMLPLSMFFFGLGFGMQFYMICVFLWVTVKAIKEELNDM